MGTPWKKGLGPFVFVTGYSDHCYCPHQPCVIHHELNWEGLRLTLGHSGLWTKVFLTPEANLESFSLWLLPCLYIICTTAYLIFLKELVFVLRFLFKKFSLELNYFVIWMWCAIYILANKHFLKGKNEFIMWTIENQLKDGYLLFF